MKKHIKNFVLLTAGSIAAIHLLNKFLKFSATVRELLKSTTGQYYDWRFGNVFYTKTGEGSPILLIHDLTTSSSGYEWCEIIDELSKKHTVYTLDLLGCGRSDKPNLTYTNFLYVQMISDFIKNVIGHKTDIIVTGDSSPFVVTACANDNSLFNKIIMINPMSLYRLNEIPSKRTKTLKFFVDLPILGTLLYNMYAMKNHMDDKFIEKYFFNPFKVKEEYINTYYESSNLKEGKYLFSSIKGRYTNLNIAHALRNVDNSMFIIGGEKEEDIHTTIEDYTHYNSSIETFIIPKTKHLPQLETPEELLEQLNIIL